MERKCGWCGKKFESKTRRAVFCSQKCKQAHYRARKNKTALPAAVHEVECHPQPVRLTDRHIALAVNSIRGGVATLDAASKRGPAEYRLLCEVVARGISEIMSEVGL